MPFALLAIFLKGPRWLKALVLISFGILFLLAAAHAFSTLRYATERTLPAHVTHGHQYPARFVRS